MHDLFGRSRRYSTARIDARPFRPSCKTPNQDRPRSQEVTFYLPKWSSPFWQGGWGPDPGPANADGATWKNGFNLTQLVELCGPTELILVRPGEFLFREGDEAQSLYVVKKGRLRTRSGSVAYETIRAGGVVGGRAPIEAGAPRSAPVLVVSNAARGETNTETSRSV